MLKTLIEVLRKEDQLQQAYNSSIQMLKSDEEMFEAAWKSLRKSDDGEITIDVRKKDVEINDYQKDIRRKVLAHLTTSPLRDMVFGLILVSIVIDIERIGDYTKNIVELAEHHCQKLSGGIFEDELLSIESKVAERFKKLIAAFEKSDTDIARGIMIDHREVSKACDKILDKIMSGELDTIPSREAVVLALYLRYLKRIGSHMTNIASGVVNPFDRVGFSA